MALPTIHILYENPDWLPPLVDGLTAEGFEHTLIEVVEGLVDGTQAPPEGIFINRMSPSSHTRGHGTSVGLMREVLAWLEAWDRRVINGSRAFELEVSKLRQDLVLRKHGILTPKTVLAVGREHLLKAAQGFDAMGVPFITKHNQGGKGLGIALFNNSDELAAHLDSDAFDAGPREQMLIQQYIVPAAPFITRVEIVGDRFLFAMQSSTEGGFELCPADACQVPLQPKGQPDNCPIDGSAKFSPAPLDAHDALVRSYIKMCRAEGIEVAGIEFVEDAEGRRYTYDINGTTNYNSALGRQVGVDGMRELARYIKREVVGAETTWSAAQAHA